MLNPDVLEIIDDPDLGGGVAFTVCRRQITRIKGSVNEVEEETVATGNIQPETKSNSPSDAEDLLDERITIYTRFILRIGGHVDGKTYLSDEIIYNGVRYRVTSVNNWSQWGFTIGHATRMRE